MILMQFKKDIKGTVELVLNTLNSFELLRDTRGGGNFPMVILLQVNNSALLCPGL